MKLGKKFLMMFSVCSLVIFGAAAAFGAALTISSAGNGVFTLQGIGLSNVGGIKATIRYDTSTLANPRVALGGLASGALMVPNTNSPGVIILGLMSSRGISGTGAVATISFDRPGGGGGRILSLNADVIDAQSKKLAVQTQVVNPIDTGSTETAVTESTSTETAQTGGEAAEPAGTTGGTQTSASSSAAAAPAAGAAFRGAGSVTTPSGETEMERQAESGQAVAEELAEVVEGGREDSAEKIAKAEVPEQKQVAYKSVIERFRDFNGEKTPESLTALFAAGSMTGVRQEPAVVLSDGETKVKVSIELAGATKRAPNFAVKGAKLVSLKKEGAEWVVEVLPDNRAYESSITVINNGAVTEIPLTVAPSLEALTGAAFEYDEAGFSLFLKEKGTDKAPRYDLNGDKKRNYIDEYIYTANYLVKQKAAK